MSMPDEFAMEELPEGDSIPEVAERLSAARKASLEQRRRREEEVKLAALEGLDSLIGARETGGLTAMGRGAAIAAMTLVSEIGLGKYKPRNGTEAAKMLKTLHDIVRYEEGRPKGETVIEAEWTQEDAIGTLQEMRDRIVASQHSGELA